MVLPTLRLERVARQWRAIAERRREHFFDLHQTGRWKLYYEKQDFLDAMRAAVELAERWALIAPRPEELAVGDDGFPLFDEARSLSNDPAPKLLDDADLLLPAA